MKALFVLSFITLSATAGEYAVLANGQRIHAERHEFEGNLIRLITTTGSIEFPAGQVRSFEKEDYIPPPSPAPAPAATAPAVAANNLPPHFTPQELLDRAAAKAGLPREIVHSIAKAESAYRQNAVSPKGAVGLMQLMPATAAALNANPYDARQNAEAGAEYLAELLARYDGKVSKAVAAYNAGPGAVDKYRGIPPYRETIDYVHRVLSDYNKRTAKTRTSAASVSD